MVSRAEQESGESDTTLNVCFFWVCQPFRNPQRARDPQRHTIHRPLFSGVDMDAAEEQKRLKKERKALKRQRKEEVAAAQSGGEGDSKAEEDVQVNLKRQKTERSEQALEQLEALIPGLEVAHMRPRNARTHRNTLRTRTRPHRAHTSTHTFDHRPR